jgi:hypothetical protein
LPNRAAHCKHYRIHHRLKFAWFPGYFVLTMLAVLIFARWRLKNTDAHKKPG